MSFIGFLSDFGLEDEWVAACKGVMYQISPLSIILDISHEIPPFNIQKGALVLAASLPYCPVGVYMAVVDPGVGGSRRPLAVKVGRGDILIGPDNGLLILAAEKLGGIELCVEITNRQYMLESVSPTFHGRDIFAAAAAHLSNGVDIAAVGPQVDPALLTGVPWPKPVIEPGRITCQIIDIDRFGTLRLSIDAPGFKELGISIGGSLWAKVSGHRHLMPFVETFEAVSAGEFLVIIDSANWVSIAQNLGSAAQQLGASIGDEAILVAPAHEASGI
ncbi:MAG TPA: SAM-dependent chlorinase/fluorinase [Anaerolineae bacterium]|nr:SAM-dependent chlorinase/fluorinase [Anaerolineae bacterium]